MQVQSMPSTGKYLQTPKRPLYENFRFCEPKISTDNRDTLLCLKILDARKFRNTEGFLLRNFSVLLHESSVKKRDT